MGRLHLAGAQAVTELWGSNGSTAVSALPLVERALVAAAPSGGPGFALMTPTYDAPGASTEVKLSERLAGLRLHRFDAHVASWTGAGLTADAVKALGHGAERAARSSRRLTVAPGRPIKHVTRVSASHWLPAWVLPGS